MDLPRGPGHDGTAAPGASRHAREWAMFTPMAFSDGLGWARIAAAQRSARAACLSVTAYIHLLRPDLPLRDLDAIAEPAIKALEDGAASVAVIDGRHRVDRVAPCGPASPEAGT